MFLNQSCFSQKKTKATQKDRQCGNTKPVQINRYPAGGPVKIVRPQIEGERYRQMATVTRVQKCTLAYSCSLGFLRCSAFSLQLHASSTHAEKLALGLSFFSRSMLASTFSIMSCGKRMPLYIVLLFMWFLVMPPPSYCLNKSKDTPVSYAVKLFKQISLTCLNTLHNLFKHFVFYQTDRNSETRQCANTNRASNHHR